MQRILQPCRLLQAAQPQPRAQDQRRTEMPGRCQRDGMPLRWENKEGSPPLSPPDLLGSGVNSTADMLVILLVSSSTRWYS